MDSPLPRSPASSAGGPATGDATALDKLTRGVVTFSWEKAPYVLAAAALLTVLFGLFAASHLGMDTKTSRLLDPTLPWRQQEIAYGEAFPQSKRVLVAVLQGATPEIASEAARRLAATLADQHERFSAVSYLAGSDFFRKNGLLFLDTEQLSQVTGKLARSAPLLGPLAADPSLRGLFDTLGQALSAVKDGMIPPTILDHPLSALADVIEARHAGRPAFLSWSDLFSRNVTNPREMFQVITLKPALDYTTLAPGRKAREAVLKAARDLNLTPAQGVTLRFTGDVALEDDEFASVKQGMGIATILSALLVLVILFTAIRSPKPVLAILLTLIAGLAATLAFAAASVHVLNLISVAFIVMFIGIAVDFGIQFCVRFRDEQARAPDPASAMRNTGAGIGGPLSLAAAATAIGFFAFAPTAYRGVSELGLIAGAGMIIALFLNLTVLPALLRYLTSKPAAEPPHLFKTAGPDRWVRRNRYAILGVSALLALGSAALLPRLAFDFNPLHLRDPNAESVRTLTMLADAGLAAPNAMQILVSDRAAIPALVARLKSLPDVGRVQSIESFIPADQDKKRAAIAEAGARLAPALNPPNTAPAPSGAEIREAARDLAERLHLLAPGAPQSYGRLAGDLDRLLNADETALSALAPPLMGGLPERLATLAALLQAQPITFESLPDWLKRQWIAPDGRFRIEVRPKAGLADNAALSRFSASIRGIAPDATGSAYFIEKSGDVVWSAFKQAFLYALIGVAALLGIMLRRVRDVALILGPLLFSALLTLGASVLIGLPLNFANVIALPLLLGIGVAFNIYFVMNWRRGQLTPLKSSTARAVTFSALTTLVAFSSLALSPHPGTASMGQLLTLCLAVTLLSALIVVPALLALSARSR